MLDLSVARRAVRTQPATIYQSAIWGGTEQSVAIASTERKPALGPEHGWLQHQIDCIPFIAKLVCDGRLELCTYCELDFEEWRGKRELRNTEGDAFAGLPVKRLQPAIERSRFRQTSVFSSYIGKDELTKFCEFLIGSDVGALKRVSEFWSRLSPAEQRNVDDLQRFRHLCRGLPQKHLADAFHLWTAETNCLDYFLLIDKPFTKAVRAIADLDFKCKPIAPDELLRGFGISDLRSESQVQRRSQ